MALQLDHVRRFPGELTGWERNHPPGSADPGDLLWSFFFGDVVLRAGDTTMASRSGSVPALHFVSGMLEAARTLARGRSSTHSYWFTEEDHQLDLRRRGDTVVIAGSLGPQTMTVPLADFWSAANGLARRVIGALGRDVPELLDHPEVRRLLSESAQDGPEPGSIDQNTRGGGPE